MFIGGSQVAHLVLRRTVVFIVLALSVTAWMTLSSVPKASACSLSTHCYAEAENNNHNANHGIFSDLNAHCLFQPNEGVGGNFLTNEIWDANGTTKYWEEVGLIGGSDFNGFYDDKNWFWADSRPNGGFTFHRPSVNQASTDTLYPAEITYVSSNTWAIYGANSFIQIGTSSGQSATLNTDIAGTEYTGGSGSGIRDIGDTYSLQRQGTGGSWLNWGTNAGNLDLGPNNYISSIYHSSNSYESWSGPC